MCQASEGEGKGKDGERRAREAGIPLALADCWLKYHVTKYFLQFLKYFSGFDDNSWVFKLVSNL